jgi:hypothetical protein
VEGGVEAENEEVSAPVQEILPGSVRERKI